MKKIVSVVFPAMVILCFFMIIIWFQHHNFYRDWEFEYYIEQFCRGERVDGNKIIETLGEPLEIEYSHYEDMPSEPVVYITLYYDGYMFGILDDSLSGSIVMICVTKPGVIKMRSGIDVGSGKDDVGRAYKYERDMIGEYGFILGKDHEIADGGGTWISMDFDQLTGCIKEITITDGL